VAHRVIRRAVAAAAVVVTAVLLWAGPASAHATLLSTYPAAGSAISPAPTNVTLRFDQSVEVSLGGIRVFRSNEQRVVTGAPHHPGGQGSQVAVSLPELAKGTYVVTWRVVSEDSHPIQGAFTFTVGTTPPKASASALTSRLLAEQGGSRAVGVLYAVVRAAGFAALAVLVGGLFFVVFVWPRGRDDARARRIVWGGWVALVVATLLSLAFEGVYASALPLGNLFDTTVFGDVLDTRFGHVMLVRLALLVVAVPVLYVALGRRPTSEHAIPAWWMVPYALVSAGLALTPGLAGHASTGIQTGVAIPVDAVHVLAMALWFGGLLVLVVAVLPREDTARLRVLLPRYSALALGAIVTLIASGTYAAWRQVGSIDALRSTDYGRLLIAKLLVFAALIVVAAFSREVVNRRFRVWPEPPVEADEVLEAAPVAVGGGGGTHVPASVSPSSGEADAGDEELDGEAIDRLERTRLRRSVWVEVLVAVAVLSLTAVLVNAAPARTVETSPVYLTLTNPKVTVYVTITPGVAGPNDVHVQVARTDGGLTTVAGLSVQLVRRGSSLAPFDVPLRMLGGDHGYAPLYTIPYSGSWQIVCRVQLSATEEVVLTGNFDLR